MPNGRVFPSATGGGLSRGTGAFLQTLIMKRQLGQRERELGQRDVQLEQQARRIDLAEETQALESLFKMIPHLPRDVPLADMPGLQDLVGKAMPSLDISDPLIGQMTLNERTLETVINDLAETRLNEVAGTPEGDALVDRLTNQLTIGKGITTEIIEAGEQVALSDAELYINSFEALKEDPVAWNSVMRVKLGLQQPVTFTDPTTGKDWTFDTSQGAALTEDLMKHWNMIDFQWQSIGAKDQVDLAAELMSQMEQFDEAIGRPTAIQIIRAFNAQNQGEQEGSLETGAGPWYDLQTSYTDSGDVGAIRAMQVFAGSAHFGEQTVEDAVLSTPTGFQAAVFGSISKMVTDAIGKEDPRQALGLTRDILNSLQTEFGIGLESPGMFRDFRLQFRNAPSARFPGMSQEGTTDPLSSTTPSGQDAVPEELFTDAANQLWGTIEDYKNGKIDIEQLMIKYPNPADRRFIIQMSRRQ